MTKVRSTVLGTVSLQGRGAQGRNGATKPTQITRGGSYHLVGLRRFDVDQCTDCDFVVLIMSRAFAGAAVFSLLRATCLVALSFQLREP